MSVQQLECNARTCYMHDNFTFKTWKRNVTFKTQPMVHDFHDAVFMEVFLLFSSLSSTDGSPEASGSRPHHLKNR